MHGSHPQVDATNVRQQNVPFSSLPMTIAGGASQSNETDLDHYVVCGIQMPATWTAANLTFRSRCAPQLVVMDVYNSDGTEMTVTAAASRFIVVDPADFAGLRFLTIRSGTTATPVTQEGERQIRLMVRAV
jgi:hypothetical protein